MRHLTRPDILRSTSRLTAAELAAGMQTATDAAASLRGMRTATDAAAALPKGLITRPEILRRTLPAPEPTLRDVLESLERRVTELERERSD